MAVPTSAIAALGVASAQDSVYRTGHLTYTCDFPLIGSDTATVQWTAAGPRSIAVGGEVVLGDVTAVIVLPQRVVAQLYDLAGVDGIGGTVNASIGVSGGAAAGLTIRGLGVAETFFDPQQDFPVHALKRPSTNVPTLTAGAAAGPLVVQMGPTFTVHADLHYQNAQPEWQRSAPFDCQLDEGQDSNLASITVS
ncbi:DUF6801 domain-containing protein [Nocardia sp. CWNU-33]|uniref:DUF6801 domain-containing protein n=1 Tax=Nocardia sp. CWNU-33 TaxID=3392117 RepID=UPI00398ECF62